MHRKSLWICFAVVHLVFFAALSSLIFSGGVLSDIIFYRQWAFDGIENGIWQGISADWVYPIGALIPMLLAAVLGWGPYQLVWFLIFTALNAAAVAVLSKPGTPVRYAASYWWLLITGLLGPVAVGRVDGLTAPLVVIALLLLAKRPVVASALLAFATWMKVWPAAVILAVLVTWRRRGTLLLTGAAVSLLMAGVVVAGGGISHLLSFIGAQGARGMQMEAPFTTPGLWQAILGGSDAYIFEDKLINTREVRGALGEPVAALMMPLLALAALAVVVLLLWAMRRGADAGQLLIAGSLALVAAFIVFNKVGSPQFMLWLGAVVAVGVAWEGRSWRVPAILMLVIAPLTTLVYPMFYAALYNDLNVVVALLLTVRNILLLVLFVWSLVRIVRLTKAGGAGRLSAPGVRPETAP
ncbi:glycosyltransferase 87 family protein [Arthrobacter sp. zg-Y1219]|uniref:glycosyltransferase 87 family protein n=1 Tax=Arthrobacter sp. zg-Y1219 TaxID=3049067 RepID=UPI0024C32BCF|nr:glycosyltransferase 87 family protein [Arthrobacter sp. zg-Y1219]